MSRRRRGAKQAETPPKGVVKQPRPVWFVTLMAFVLPGSGQVFNGAPARGVIMQFGMVFGAFVTYMLTTPEISPVGRMAGGLLVYVFSIVDAHGIAKLRVKAWERIQAGQPPRQRRSMKPWAAAGAGPSAAPAPKTPATPARRKKRPARRPAEKPGVPEGSADGSTEREAGSKTSPELQDAADSKPLASERPSG